MQMNCRQKIMDEGIAKDSTDDDDTRQAEAYLASNIADPDPFPIRHEDGTVHWQGEKQASTSTTAPQRSGGCRPLCLARAGTLGALLAPTEHCGDASPLEADPMSDSDGPPPLVDSSSESDDPDIIAALQEVGRASFERAAEIRAEATTLPSALTRVFASRPWAAEKGRRLHLA